MASERAAAGRFRGLYAITPEGEEGAALAASVADALAGGAAMVQYRAKHAQGERASADARALAGLCRAAGVPLIVNDSLELARAAGADGVHLGRDDLDVAHARAAWPAGIIGASCYDDPERARAAARAGADYVAIGSVFPSTTKPGARRAPLASLAAARRASGLPVVAIGGITLANAPLAIEAGADMVAAIAAVFAAPDVRAASRAFARLFTTAADVRTQPRAL